MGICAGAGSNGAVSQPIDRLHMNTRLLCIALLCLSARSAQAQESSLFRMHADAAGQPAMVFQEVARDDRTSTVELLHPGGSVLGKSMFMLRAGCSLMKERGMPGFTIEALSRQPLRLLMRFASAEEAREQGGQPLREGGLISAAHCEAITAAPAPRAPEGRQ